MTREGKATHHKQLKVSTKAKHTSGSNLPAFEVVRTITTSKLSAAAARRMDNFGKFVKLCFFCLFVFFPMKFNSCRWKHRPSPKEFTFRSSTCAAVPLKTGPLFSAVQDCICALGKVHMHSTSPLIFFFHVASAISSSADLIDDGLILSELF